MAPALVVPSEEMKSSPLAPICIFWTDWNKEQQETIQQLRKQGVFRLKAISKKSGLMEPDILENLDDAAILPAGGNIGLVRKVGQEKGSGSNCRLEIVVAAKATEEMDAGSTGLVLELIATKDIEAGEELRLNLPDNSSWHARINLAQHLALTGQAVPMHLWEAKIIPTMTHDPPDDGEPDL
jgi:hypothetical protein